MKIENLSDKITIVNGDCLEYLRTLDEKSIDLIVTDPPYNMAYNGRGKINSFEIFENDDLTDENHSKWFSEILVEMHRVLKDDSAIYIWIDWRNYARFYGLIKQFFDIKNCIVWDKTSIGMGQYYRFQHEFCIYSHKGKPILNVKGSCADVWQIKRETGYEHPTQKPITLMYKCLQNSSSSDNIILDPFMGSGSTLVAAEMLGLRAIGIELDEKYYELSKRRLLSKINQATLF
jgi:site-specific DNA-methyltransferase (adenine-specific)